MRHRAKLLCSIKSHHLYFPHTETERRENGAPNPANLILKLVGQMHAKRAKNNNFYAKIAIWPIFSMFSFFCVKILGGSIEPLEPPLATGLHYYKHFAR